jgi:hypothetical protein
MALFVLKILSKISDAVFASVVLCVLCELRVELGAGRRPAGWFNTETTERTEDQRGIIRMRMLDLYGNVPSRKEGGI